MPAAAIAKCVSPKCNGTCLGEVVAAGWAGIRPGGIPHCRLCRAKFPRPSVADNTVLVELYKAKYNTIDELATKSEPARTPKQQPPTNGLGQPLGPRGAAKPNPWDANKSTNKELAQLRQKVKELESANGKFVAAQAETSFLRSKLLFLFEQKASLSHLELSI